MDKEKLKTFLRLLKMVFRMKSQTFDLGLIVKEPKGKTSSDEVFQEIKKEVEIEKVVYDESVSDEDIIDKLVEIFDKGKWAFLEIKKDIKSPLLNQLKHLANHNFLQLIDYKGKDLVEIKMPETYRVIVFAERDFIENKISYPHFYRLFGPTLSLE